MAGDDHQLHDHYGPEARYAVRREAELPTSRWDEEVARALELGLPGVDSLVDKRIPTVSRGELPHFAGINTFPKASYVEDVRFAFGLELLPRLSREERRSRVDWHLAETGLTALRKAPAQAALGRPAPAGRDSPGAGL